MFKYSILSIITFLFLLYVSLFELFYKFGLERYMRNHAFFKNVRIGISNQELRWLKVAI